jgi:hypothetical protein
MTSEGLGVWQFHHPRLRHRQQTPQLKLKLHKNTRQNKRNCQKLGTLQAIIERKTHHRKNHDVLTTHLRQHSPHTHNSPIGQNSRNCEQLCSGHPGRQKELDQHRPHVHPHLTWRPGVRLSDFTEAIRVSWIRRYAIECTDDHWAVVLHNY